MQEENKLAFINTLVFITNNEGESVTLTNEQVRVIKLYLAELTDERDIDKIIKILVEIAKITMVAAHYFGDS